MTSLIAAVAVVAPPATAATTDTIGTMGTAETMGTTGTMDIIGPISTIDEVLVTATRRPAASTQISSALTLIDTQALRDGKLVTDALADSPGVFLQQTTPGQGAAIIRGLKGSAILHLVDGMRLNNAIFRSAPTQYLALVPTTAVERIEILRGTPASLYGSDAVGGAVQLVSRVPRFDASDVELAGDLVAGIDTADRERSIRATLDAGNKRLAASLGLEFLETGDRRIGGGETLEAAGYESRAFRLALAGTPDQNRSWLFDVHHLEQPSTPRIDELVPGFGQTEPASSEFLFAPNRRSFVHGRYSHKAGPLDVDWDLGLAWQRIEDDRITRDFQADVRRLEQNRSDLIGMTLSGTRTAGAGSWIVGAELYFDRVASTRFEENLSDGRVSPITSRFPDGSEVGQAALYANVEQPVGPRHRLNAGLRWSYVDVRLASTPVSDSRSILARDLSGDIGWIVDVGERLQFVVNAGAGFRAPNVFDLGTLGNRPGNRFNLPNTRLDSEQALQLDTGLRYRGRSVGVELMLFALDYRDRITTVSTGETTAEGRDIVRSENGAESRIYGAELDADFEIADGLSANLVLNYTWGEQRDEGGSTEPADRIPPLTGRLGFDADPGSDLRLRAWLSFAVRQSRLSARDIGDPRIDPRGTAGWVSAGLVVSWDVADDWWLDIGIDNVLDKAYREHGSGVDAVGRNLSLRLGTTW